MPTIRCTNRKIPTAIPIIRILAHGMNLACRLQASNRTHTLSAYGNAGTVALLDYAATDGPMRGRVAFKRAGDDLTPSVRLRCAQPHRSLKHHLSKTFLRPNVGIVSAVLP
jgi:hypothetical protein